MKQVPLSSGFPFFNLFPNVQLRNRAEGFVQDQCDSGFPRFRGDPEVLIAYASGATIQYTAGAAFLSHGMDNEASRVLQFSNVIQYAGRVAEDLKAGQVAFPDATTLETATVSVPENESPAGSTHSTPEKGLALSLSTPRSEQGRTGEGDASQDASRGEAVSLADSALDAGVLILHEFVHGDVFKQISTGSRTELVIAKNDEKGNPYFRGAMELSQNLMDKAYFKKKKEQVPATAVLLNMHNFDRGIFNRRTYVVSCDGRLGYACCFVPNMKGVEWRAKKMTGRAVKGDVYFSQCFTFLDSVNRTADKPFEATKSTLYAMECIATLCSPELEAIPSVERFWDQLLRSEVQLATLGVQVLEPMFLKPLHYDRPIFKNEKTLPADLMARYEDGRRAHTRATAHLRALAEYHRRLANGLAAEADTRDKEEDPGAVVDEEKQRLLAELSKDFTMEELEALRKGKKAKVG